MSDKRSDVMHHPLISDDSPIPGTSPVGTPIRGFTPEPLLPDIDMVSFTAPPDPALNLLEVPSINWTRSPDSENTSLASSTCDMSAPVYDPNKHRPGQQKNNQLIT
ncbi:hypothetical protein SK128_028083 [Halocaridina rubra]|uniref:Uncharacterized protein n=1 Tax=Halocaridina rubra TaxID=373956 RepID=A0AAN8XG11_HALRR